MTRTCPQCERSFEPKASHQIYDFQECRQQGWVEKEVVAAQTPAQRVGAIDLSEVRARGEEAGGDKSRWTLIARAHITHTLIATSYFSAEDFDALGIPPEHVNVCTSWIGHFSKRKVMEPISWRYSQKPSRKGGKVWTYRITQKGREELPALLQDTRSELAGLGIDNSSEANMGAARKEDAVTSVDAEPGEKENAGVGGSADSPALAASHAGVTPSTGASPLPASAGEPEPLSLLPEPDPKAWAA